MYAGGFWLVLSLLLTASPAYGQEIWEDPDSLLLALETGAPLHYDDIRAYVQVNLVGPESKEPIEQFLIEAGRVAEAAGNTVGRAHVKNGWALYHNIFYESDEDVEASVAYEKEAIDLFTGAGQRLMTARAQLDLGTDLTSLGRYDEAEAPMLAAIPVLEELAEPLVLSEGYSRLSFLYSGLGESAYVKEYATKALELSSWEESPYLYLSAADELARALNNLGDHAEVDALAREVFDKRHLLAEPDDADTYVRIQAERALALVELGEPQRALTALDEAWGTHREVIGEYDPRLRRMDVYRAYVHREMGHDEAAVLAYDQFINFINERQSGRIGPFAAEVGLSLIPYLKTKGRFEEALNYSQWGHRDQRISDSTEIVSLKAAQVISYETGRKEALIQEQETQLSRQRLILMAIGVGLFAALAFGVSLFVLSRKLARRNGEYRKLLAHKEALVSEIHHRVKNNLQMLSSLFRLQGKAVAGDSAGERGARNALRDGGNRIEAMGLLHQKLYASGDVTYVNAHDYFGELGGEIIAASPGHDEVDLYQDIEDVQLDIDTAIPLGLIYNELITNSVKHAFPDGRPGTVEVELYVNEHDALIMSVKDNGIGDSSAPRHERKGFGSRLTQLLSSQLEARVEVISSAGYTTTITVPDFSRVNNLSVV